MILRKLFNKPSNTRPKVAGQENSFHYGNTEVVLLKADNANLPIKVDVIVTTISSNLNHGIATASSTIAEKAGIPLQRKIQEQKIKLPLGEDDIIATSGGKLACSKVYYVTLLPRKQHHTAAIKTLIWKCLEKANLSSFKSLAFPALGTGKLHYPHSDVAYAMFGAVGEYSAANPTSSVCRVFFVILPSNTDVLNAFKEANKSERTPSDIQFQKNILI
ncbi:hypothetical protein DPMN_047146 [Dreissena polymorpha]|uniref:Macro domain-containing protein n=1 Tax=Dreissena polymorpha TaxID=45954 RepID=A0A9D4HYV4_DREPO|nr:hypothetical protein DPMN_047146 [Dreissena polymorpha]